MNKVYKSKRTSVKIEILHEAGNCFIYKVLNGMNIGYIGQISKEELRDRWELIKLCFNKN